MKKKLLATLLVLSFACVQFTGCGQDEKKEETSEKKTETVEEDTEKTEKTEEKTKKTEEKKKLKAERGVIADGVYTNETFGVSFPVSENLIVYTDEQIATSLSLGQDVLAEDGKYSVEDMEEVMQGAMYDTIILFSDNKSNVSVVYEDLEQSQAVELDEEQYAKAVSNMLSSLEAMQYEVGEITKQDIGGTEFTALSATAEGFNQKYFLHQVENYMIEFIFTYTDETEQEVNDFISSISYKNPL